MVIFLLIFFALLAIFAVFPAIALRDCAAEFSSVDKYFEALPSSALLFFFGLPLHIRCFCHMRLYFRHGGGGGILDLLFLLFYFLVHKTLVHNHTVQGDSCLAVSVGYCAIWYYTQPT